MHLSGLLRLMRAKVSLEAAFRASKEAAAGEAVAAAELRKELATRPTVAEVKTLRHQLRVLQQLEFNANNDDEEEVRLCVRVCTPQT